MIKILTNKFFLLILIAVVSIIFILFNRLKEEKKVYKQVPVWEFRSVDTVKSSRDLAGQMLGNEEFEAVINEQVSDIAFLGASHIAISTPYDKEFLPFLKRWVNKARQYGLKVWFRGNFSGWEKWFNHKPINRDEHKKLLKEFIVNNPDLFEDGDIFTSCPECENGGPGDPRHNGQLLEHRKFLIEEYQITEDAFRQIGKQVQPGFYSMNYDVANLVMDKETTQRLGNLVVIDHYIKDPKQLAADAKKIAEKSGGKVVLGEIGAPIPDIHGSFDEMEQAEWIEAALSQVESVPEIIGLNYWTNVGGSSHLWNDNGDKRMAADVIEKYFRKLITIEITP